jgi:hypothetical protein
MTFNKASEVEQICYEFKLADFPRGLDRARIDDLLNGVPPYTQAEVRENRVAINVNYLEGTRLAHDARMQFNGNFLKPGRYFTSKTDMGAPHKRSERSSIVTQAIAKRMKRSAVYYETFRSKFALLVAHGIGPAGWDRDDFWCPDAYGIEDVLIPANTLLTMKNLPFFALYHSYTGPELIKLTRDEKLAAEAGWNMSLVKQCLEYIDREATALMGTNWPEVWSPEKLVERVKGDGGFYAGDQVPTIDCFDFYFWDDSEGEEGWKRRVILDSWSTPSGTPPNHTMGANSKTDFARNQFLFNSGKRKVATSWREIVAFQFADLSAVAPFRYHSIRAIGYLLYAICNLQNRLRCKFNEAVFEALMMYFRVRSGDDAERALKIELVSQGFIDETVQFVPADQRFQVNHQLVQLGLQQNQQMINENSSSWTQSANRSNDRTEKTKFQVMAEIQAMTAMISAGLQQAYRYQEFEYDEIFRRFLLKNSRDPDIVSFRAEVIKKGVPDRMLIPEAWENSPERILGEGNKTLEMAIAEQLMQYRNLYDPEPQRQILRDVTLAITSDAAKSEMLVPLEATQVTDSVMLAQAGTTTLLMGLPWTVKTGVNHIEYVDAMLQSFAAEVMKHQQKGGMATQEQIEGMANVFTHLQQQIALVAQDPAEKDRVKQWGDGLGKLMNLVKAFVQRLKEQMKQQQAQGGNGQDAELQAKLQAIQMTAQAKMQNTRESHAQRTAQRQVQFEMEEKRKQQEHQMEMQKETHRVKLELGAKHAASKLELAKQAAQARLALAAERKKQRMKSTESE